MRHIAAITILCLALTGSPLAQPDVDFCQEAADRIGPPESILSLLQHYPMAELSAEGGGIVTPASFLGRPAMPALVEKFRPTPELAEIFRRLSRPDGIGLVQVLGFTGSDVHAVWTLGGSDDCMSFYLFEAPAGGEARLLPKLPAFLRTEEEGGLCEPHSGFLVKWRNEIGFIVRDEVDMFHGALRYVPLRGRAWGRGCRVEYELPVTFAARTVFQAAGGPLPLEKLSAELANIAAARFTADQKGEPTFSYSNTGQPARQVPRHTITQIYRDDAERKPFPTFGGGDALAQGLTYSPSEDELGSVRIDGKPYFARAWLAMPVPPAVPGPVIEMPRGFRYLVILYKAEENTASLSLSENDPDNPAIASAIVETGYGQPRTRVTPLN